MPVILELPASFGCAKANRRSVTKWWASVLLVGPRSKRDENVNPLVDGEGVAVAKYTSVRVSGALSNTEACRISVVLFNREVCISGDLVNSEACNIRRFWPIQRCAAESHGPIAPNRVKLSSRELQNKSLRFLEARNQIIELRARCPPLPSNDPIGSGESSTRRFPGTEMVKL